MLFNSDFSSARIETRGAQINLMHGGKGPPLLLVHGYPQTHVMWHKVANELAQHFHVICPDLRGYGDSSKPVGEADHANYSKRAMAQDLLDVMDSLGYEQFMVAGHDRGARVTHRLALDHSQRVTRACVMDITPTLHMFEHTDQAFATGYYHWFFLIQPDGLPEGMIGADPEFYLKQKIGRWSGDDNVFDPQALAEYLRCFCQPETIHASCEDYRAAASIDLDHDKADRGRRLECPLLVLWGEQGFVHRNYDVLTVWRDYATDVRGSALPSGHFVAEEAPEQTLNQMLAFFQAGSA